jgi:O-antigen ligase
VTHPPSLMGRAGRAVDLAAFALLLATIIYAPIAQGSLYPWSTFGLRSLVALTLVLTGLAVALRGEFRLPPTRIAVAYGGFLTLYLLSSLFSPNTFGVQQGLIDTGVQASGFALALALVHSRRRRALFLTALLTGALGMAVYGFIQVLGHGVTPTMHEPMPPISSFYYNRIHYAGFLDLAAPTALGVLLFAPRWWVKLLAGTLALALYFNLGLTFSDAGWAATGLSTLALLGLWVAAAPSNRLRRLRVGLMTLMLLVGSGGVGAFLAFSPDLSGTLETRVLALQGRTADGNPTHAGLGGLHSSLEIYRGALRIIEEHPWVGVGPGNFIYALPKWRPPTATDVRSAHLHRFVNYAHNDYLQVASEAGIPAALFFVLFWLSVLSSLRAHLSPLTGLRFGLIALLLHGFVDGNLTVNHAAAFLAFLSAGVLAAPGQPEAATTTESA